MSSEKYQMFEMSKVSMINLYKTNGFTCLKRTSPEPVPRENNSQSTHKKSSKSDTRNSYNPNGSSA